MAKYAEDTQVSSIHTREEIEHLLAVHGATQFVYGWDQDNQRAVLAFSANGRKVRFFLPMPNRDSPEITRTPGRGQLRGMEAQQREYEQAVRQKWRALFISIKARFAAIEAEITCFEREFFYDTVLPNGKTVGECLEPQVKQAYLTGEIPSLLPMLENRNGMD